METNLFKCNDCLKAFRNKKLLQQHRNRGHGRYACFKCTLVFDKKIELLNHEKEKHPITCEFCSKTFSIQSRLNIHINSCRIKFEQEEQKKSKKIDKEELTKCVDCNCTFVKKFFKSHCKTVAHVKSVLKKYEHCQDVLHYQTAFDNNLCIFRIAVKSSDSIITNIFLQSKRKCIETVLEVERKSRRSIKARLGLAGRFYLPSSELSDFTDDINLKIFHSPYRALLEFDDLSTFIDEAFEFLIEAFQSFEQEGELNCLFLECNF